MDKEELLEAIEKGEDSFTEFKEEKAHSIEKNKINNKIVLCIYIPKGPERPYRTNRGVYYIRTSSGKRQTTREELLRLYQATRSFYYDELPVPATSVDELDILYFRRFFERFYQTRIEEDLDLNKLL